MSSAMSIAEKLERHSIPEPNSGCLLWMGACVRNGYGYLGHKRKCLRAHRAAYAEVHGPIPDDLYVLHKCDVPACINPGHLFLGTHDDNMADRKAKDRNKGRGKRGGWMNATKTLTAEQIPGIRSDPRSNIVIGNEYGVTGPTISDVKRRVSWKHIP